MSESRAAARARALELRDEHRRRDRRRAVIVTAAIVSGVLVAGLIVTLVLVTADRRYSRGPQNMLSDGIKIGADFVAVRTPAIAVGGRPVVSDPNPSDVVAIQIYFDYLCPNCGTFVERNGEQLRAWIETGAATVELHPLAIFTAKSGGTQYAARAANAAACIAESSPDQFFAFHEALFADQPDENEPGPSNQELVDLAKSVDVEDLGEIADCIERGEFRIWVKAATDRAVTGPIEGTDVLGVASTPTIIVNGTEFKYTTAFDPNEFAQFVARAAGQQFSENPTPTPTPTETPAP